MAARRAAPTSSPGSVPVPSRVRSRVRVEGVVQGVGFRPFVHALANALGLAGMVGNDGQGVFVEAEGDEAAVARFIAALEHDAPPLAVIERIVAEPLAPTGETSFAIALSPAGGERRALISPDVATCAPCLAEMWDPGDRRHRYAFTNCTNCGPRFSIVLGVPYDRPRTTMGAFPMCPDCAEEYHDPGNRRFHAQPVCCPACGPRLVLCDRHGNRLDGDPVAATARLLAGGAVVAVKGLGGYHLAVVAGEEGPVAGLRARKHREDKPFAVMAPDLRWAARLGRVEAGHERLLDGWRHPIVLLERFPADGALVAPSVAPGNRFLGVMLPYTPLHHLLAAELGRPFVLTSGNLSDEPIAYEDGDAVDRLGGVADAFLTHDRAIHTRVDDSVVRAVEGREMVLRRSRGYAPMPLRLPQAVPVPVLGCGAELKSTFCLARGAHAFLSHHIGDLENWETLRSYREGIAHYRELFDIEPAVIAHDLHPEYLSTKWAMDEADADPGLTLTGVQHHHAHLAACLADNGEEGPVIGVIFDGLGYGSDGSLWGGEVLVGDLLGFDREAHFLPVPLPGGKAAINEPWRMAASYVDAAFGDDLPEGLDVYRRHAGQWPA
ncbi:MAG: carbamoyltransferase HypF, partial [Acidimicrobiales bacterium]